MTLVEAWPILLGAIAPILAAIINRPSMTGNQRRLVVGGICVLLGVGYVIATRQVVIHDSVGAIIERGIVVIALIVVASQGVYQLLRPLLDRWQGVVPGETAGEPAAPRRAEDDAL